jgi:hypothetical protein
LFVQVSRRAVIGEFWSEHTPQSCCGVASEYDYVLTL